MSKAVLVALILCLVGCARFSRVDLYHDWEEVGYVAVSAGSRMDLCDRLSVEAHAGTYHTREGTDPLVGGGFTLYGRRWTLDWTVELIVGEEVESYGYMGFEIEF